jgi:predicted DNA-binding protein
MKREEIEKIKEQLKERLSWSRGVYFKFAKETRIITEEDFNIVYRILEELEDKNKKEKSD